MLNKINIEKMLFLDIETVPAYPVYKDVPSQFKKLWDKKAERLRQSDSDTPESIYSRAGIYAEFGKIICISTAFLSKDEFRIKSFFGDEENKILKDFVKLLNDHFNANKYLLCAHNGKEFDFPFLARRILINEIQLPRLLDIAGKKPWEIAHIDTMELWKFGDYKHYTSLELLANIFNVPSPKDDIGGGDVSRVYWKEKDMKRIVHYCQKDVLTVAQLFLKYQGKSLLPESQIHYVK
ncbi:MAG: 3'-5' exonuclease [Bacteroidetes bacterium]|nr:3'-5' exonuclease [Bacteroidota bacterium]